ncbi:MAG: GNAT family protein [Hyphomicrobiaceae bacterium]|nr:GNAT family protein [Hyphomicrobiaceae bacterium]
MSFLISGPYADPGLVLRGGQVVLRPLSLADHGQWAELRQASRAHLSPWEPIWPGDELSRTAFRRRVRHFQREAHEDQGYAFGVFAPDEATLLGGASLSNVRRGVTQAAVLGYWIGARHARRGLMSQAVRLCLGFAFERLRLHRVEAASMPSNIASINVLERNGFQREGLARRYLKINGAWEDHYLFALIEDDFARGAGER